MKRRRKSNPFSLFSFQDIITGLCGIMIFMVMVMVVDLVNAREGRDVSSDTEDPVVLNERELEAFRAEIQALRKRTQELEEALKDVVVDVANEVKPDLNAKQKKELTEKEREAAALLSQVKVLETKLAKMKEADAKCKQKILEMEQTRRLLQEKILALKNKKGITLIPEWGEAKIPVYVICDGKGVEILRPLAKTTKRLFFPHDGARGPFIDNIVKLDHTVYTVVMMIRPSGIPYMDRYIRLCKNFGYTIGRDPLEEDVEITLTKARGE